MRACGRAGGVVVGACVLACVSSQASRGSREWRAPPPRPLCTTTPNQCTHTRTNTLLTRYNPAARSGTLGTRPSWRRLATRPRPRPTPLPRSCAACCPPCPPPSSPSPPSPHFSQRATTSEWGRVRCACVWGGGGWEGGPPPRVLSPPRTAHHPHEHAPLPPPTHPPTHPNHLAGGLCLPSSLAGFGWWWWRCGRCAACCWPRASTGPGASRARCWWSPSSRRW